MPVRRDALGGEPAQEPDKPPRRKRRTKAQIEADNIAAAKIPNDDEEVTVVFEGTGAPERRLWPEAAALRRRGEVTLSDKDEFAFKKLEQEVAQQRTAEDAEFEAGDVQIPRDDQPVQLTVEGAKVTWPWSAVVAHVIDNGNANVEFEGDLYPRALDAVRQQRAAAATPPPDPGERVDEPPPVPAAEPDGPVAPVAPDPGPSGTSQRHSAEKPYREETPIIEQIDVNVWKVGMGFIEKIGLPDYSSLAIGPCTASRHVLDDGRRSDYQLTGRKGGETVSLPTAVVDALTEASNICEVVMRAERTAMINFLEQTRPGSGSA